VALSEKMAKIRMSKGTRTTKPFFLHTLYGKANKKRATIKSIIHFIISKPFYQK